MMKNRWKSRQRYSDDSGSESDDEQHLPGLRYHQQQQRPNLSQYVSDGGAPGTGGSGGDGSSHGLSNIKTVHLEPLVKSSQVATDLAVSRSCPMSGRRVPSSAHPPTATHPHSERIKYKAEIPISVIRAAQAKTRR